MNTILLVLAAITLAFYCVGAVALIVDNKLSDFFEFYTQYNGWIVTALSAFNALLLTFATALGMLGATQIIILIVYAIFSIAMIALTIKKYKA